MRYLILIGLVVAAMFGYYFYWNSLADTLVAGIERWIDQRRADGYEIDHAGYDVRGFPFRLTLVVEAPRIARPAAPNGFDWRATGSPSICNPGTRPMQSPTCKARNAWHGPSVALRRR